MCIRSTPGSSFQKSQSSFVRLLPPLKRRSSTQEASYKELRSMKLHNQGIPLREESQEVFQELFPVAVDLLRTLSNAKKKNVK